jgi:hypothetical protein
MQPTAVPSDLNIPDHVCMRRSNRQLGWKNVTLLSTPNSEAYSCSLVVVRIITGMTSGIKNSQDIHYQTEHLASGWKTRGNMPMLFRGGQRSALM